MPVVNACATDARGLVTCVRDLVDRRFDLPGEVTRQASPTPSALPRPDPRPIKAEAPPLPPAPVAEPVPETRKAESPPAQGGPFIPPAPERIADLQPAPVTPRPQPVAPQEAPPAPANPLPLAGRDGVGGAPNTDVAVPAQPAAKPETPAPATDPAEPIETVVPPAPADSLPLAGRAGEGGDPSTDVEVPAQPASKPDTLAVTTAPSEPAKIAPAAPADSLPLAGRAGEGGDPSTDVELPAQPAAKPETPVVATAPSYPARITPQPPADPLPLAGSAGEGGDPSSDSSVPAELQSTPPAGIAAGPEWLPEAGAPDVAAPLALIPTIDAIELDGARSIVSGTGPAGALMRLFADGDVVGESQVEEGRWQVETGPLLTLPKRELKIQAIDPETGRSLGETVITVEIELPPDAEPFDPAPAAPKPVTPTPPPPKPAAGLTAQTNPPATIVVRPRPQPEPTADPEPPPPVQPRPSPEPAAEPVPAAEAEAGPEPIRRKLPGLRPVTPQRGSSSVTVLGRPDGSPSTSFVTID